MTTPTAPTIYDPDSLSAAVLAVMQRTPDPRLREIMLSLVTHLHSFVRDVKLTEAEFRSACALIAKLGQQTTATHNEVVLMAGSLGVSSLVCLQNNAAQGEPTTQNLLGPFWRMDSPRVANGGSLLRSATPGPALYMSARVLDAAGLPVVGAEVDIWHCAPTGLYENQDAARAQGQADMNLRGKFTTDAQGAFSFWSVRPIGYPIPTTGVVGQLLIQQQRHPMRPAHIHALIYQPGFKTLISQVYADDDLNLSTDAQFGVTEALTAHWVAHDEPLPAAHPRPVAQTGPWYSLDFTFHMQRGAATLPRPPIK